MSQEKMKILEMLEKGNISAEEAIKLMQYVESEKSEDNVAKSDEKNQDGSADTAEGGSQSTEQNTWQESGQNQEPGCKGGSQSGSGYGYQYGKTEDQNDNMSGEETNNAEDKQNQGERKEWFDFDADWIHEIKDNIKDTVENIAHYVESSDALSMFPFAAPTETLHYTYTDVEHIRSLQLSGRNSKVELVSHLDDRIEVTVNYKVKRGMDPRIEFESVGGDYRVKYDYSAVSAIGFYVRMPQRMINYLDLETSNSKLIVEGLKAGKAVLTTKNGVVNVSNYQGDDLAIETKNAPVYVDDLKLSRISIKTSNSSITIKDTNAEVVKAMTSNAAVKVEHSILRDVSVKTSNGNITFDDYNIKSGASFYNMEARTSNSSIKVQLPQFDDLDLRLSAITSNGHVNANMRRLDFFEQHKGYLKTETKDFENAESKMNISLQTSNGNINISE